MELKIVSFNCNSIKRNAEIVNNLLASHDIICLKETFLPRDNLNFLNQFDENFNYEVTPSVENNSKNCFGRSSGGLVIFWRKSLMHYVCPVNFTDRIMGLKITTDFNCCLILNVYMPCDYRNIDSLILYRDTIAQISHILDRENVDQVVIVGDINGDPAKGRFFQEFSTLAAEYNLKFDDLILPPDSFTYLSAGHSFSTSWLDHIVSSNNAIITDVNIMYGHSLFDHIPIEFNLKVKFLLPKFEMQEDLSPNFCHFVSWDKLNGDDLASYRISLENLLNSYNNDSLMCTNRKCTLVTHKSLLDDAFSFLNKCFKKASEHLNADLPNKSRKLVVGWSDHCRDLFKSAKQKFLLWRNGGRIRSGILFEEMKKARNKFKNALDYCKRNETKIKKKKLLESFQQKSKNNFWKNINKLNGKPRQPNMIDNKCDKYDIVNVFSEKYKEILDNPHCQTSDNESETKIKQVLNEAHLFPRIKFNFDLTKNAILKLNTGIDLYGIHSNHLKCGPDALTKFLARLFEAFMFHDHVPTSALIGEIRPIVKNNLGDKTSSENYRPIMNSSYILRSFEHLILNVISKRLKINAHQFGYRKNTSCIMANAVIKEVVSTYNDCNSNVYCAFIDLSKAFDRVNHTVLYTKLIDKNVEPMFVKMLKTMYDNQYVHVVFNNVHSPMWKVGNGVRQGGILSPLLFNIYIDDILSEIEKSDYGCLLSHYKVNILGFADDIILLSPSANGIQSLIDKLDSMLSKISLLINFKKSCYMLIKCKKYRKVQIVSKIFLNGCKLKQVDEYKYLGIIISSNNSVSSDISRVCSSFLKQFYSVYRKFCFTDFNVMLFLFKTHCLSFYGAELWSNVKASSKDFRTLAVAYHKCIKRIRGLPVWESNHKVCEQTGLNTFEHLVNKKIVSFLFSIINNDSPCLKPLNFYFRRDSYIVKNVQLIFNRKYQINDVLNNEVAAVKARIDYVERREPRSNPDFFFVQM